jgi:succinylglutamate desuccinylase
MFKFMSVFSNYLEHILEENSCTHESLNLTEPKLSLREVAFGIVEIIPENSSLAPAVLSCGVHGNETAPIEIMNDLLGAISNQEINVARPLLFIFAHVKAMKEHKRYIDFNMNRLFCGNHLNYPKAQESKRAKELEEIMAKFYAPFSQRPWHLDLHTAIRPSHVTRFAVFPHQENGVPTKEEMNLLANLDIDAILLANGKASTFSAHSCENFGAYAYTLELGKVYPFGKNPHEKFKAVKKGLIQFIKSDSILEKTSEKLPIQYKVEKELIKDSENYLLHLEEDYANFTPIAKGTLLETLKSGPYKTKEECAVVFPNNDVPIGQRTGLLVKKQS